MKKQNLILTALSFAIFAIGYGANCYGGNSSKTPTFDELLGKTIQKVQTAPTSENLLNCVSELKRINAIYPDNWLAYYYGALYELQYSLLNLSSDTNTLLTEAKETVEQLKKNKNANASEVYTLEGYLYYTLIAKDPAKNGSVYYKNVFESYQKALNFNPNNPRARLLLLTFKQNMGQFLGEQPENMCQELNTIKKLFENEPVQTLEPRWGRSSLDKMLEQYPENNISPE